MNASQIRELTDSGLFEAGAHSVNHPALGTLSSSDQKAEIEISKEELENIVANPITGFAYPYGHYNEKTPVLTKRAGFRYALTTAEHKVTLQDSVFEIPRFQVKDIAADELVKNIRLWQTR